MAIIGSITNWGEIQGEINDYNGVVTGVISNAELVGGQVVGMRGLKGDKGNTGDTGVGIASVTKTGTVGLVDTYTITYTNGNTATFELTNGQDGQDGADGHSPVVTAEKVGKTTTVYVDGVATATILDGNDGQDGQDGADGFSPIANVSKAGDTATITITDEIGTTTATVKDGTDGADGQDGYSPSATVSKVGDTATITITDKDGTTTATVKDGQDSADENVKQQYQAESGYTYWRPLLIGKSSNSTEGFTPSSTTDQTYAFKTLEVQPSSGTIRMGKASMFNGSYTHKVSPTTLTANRTATLPDKSGTIAFTDDIPPLVTDLGNIDPSDYDDDLEEFLNTLTDDGNYKFVWEDGDDFEYFVEIQSMVENGNGYVLQHYWFTEEGAKYQYNRSAYFEDGECVGSDIDNYLTLSDATDAYATKNHNHYETVSKAKTVWDYCDDELQFDNGKPYIIYADTLNSKNWLIERYSATRSPNQRYIRLYDLGDASHFYLRSGLYSAGVITWGSWKEYPSGGGGGGGVSDVTIDGTSIVTGGVAELGTVTQLRDGIMTALDKQKLDAIESGAEVNVQSDWNQSTNTADDYIKNKPTIPSKTSDLNNDSGFITSPNVVYCTCDTAGGTAAKVATIVSGTLTTLNTGDQAIVKFANANSVASPTLKIGTTDAKSIRRYGTSAPSTSAATSWNADSPILFVYDGTYWRMIGWLNTTYSEISEANITNSSGSSTGLVTGRRVKKAVETFAPVTSVNGKTGAVTIDSDVYIATYNVTEYSDILMAISQGKEVVCAYTNTVNGVTLTYYAPLLTYSNGDNPEYIIFSCVDYNTEITIVVDDMDIWVSATDTLVMDTDITGFISEDSNGDVDISGAYKTDGKYIGSYIKVTGTTTGSSTLTTSTQKIYMDTQIEKKGNAFYFNASLTGGGIHLYADGTVLFSGKVRIGQNYNGSDIVMLEVWVNSTAVYTHRYRVPPNMTTPAQHITLPTIPLTVSAGDRIYLYAYNATAGRGTVLNDETEIYATFIAPTLT